LLRDVAADADDVVAGRSPERLEEMIRSMIFSACFISRATLRSVVVELEVAPVLTHLGLQNTD